MSFQYVPLAEERLPARKSPSNRRAAVRYHCGPATPGKVLLVEGQEWQRAWVLDLSLGGVGLLLNRPLEAGLSIVVVLKCSTTGKSEEILARVCHSSRQADGDWVVGCEFTTKLNDEQLDRLL